jgi:hypothetical protein
MLPGGFGKIGQFAQEHVLSLRYLAELSDLEGEQVQRLAAQGDVFL